MIYIYFNGKISHLVDQTVPAQSENLRNCKSPAQKT